MRLKVDIEKRLGSFLLKSKIDIDSEMIAVLGASGSGKSMTLKCICGIEKPDKGRIILGDEVLFDSEKKINVPTRKRKIGYLFQDYALFPNMTVKENIECASTDLDYAKNLIKKFDLEDVKNKYPSQLSGGQSQRCALARMLANKPKVLMFDEPFSALDNHLKNRVEHEILDIISKFDGPMILVSHDRNEVYRLARKIGIMDNGNLIDIQDRDDFFDNPRTVTSARLTGCKNISNIEYRDEKIYAKDWGIYLDIPKQVLDKKKKDLEKIKYVGYRGHYFKLKEKLGVNTFKCHKTRIIEDTFSVTVCFKQSGNKSEGLDSVLTWIISKPVWLKIKDKIDDNEFYLQLDSSKLILLER